MIEECDSPSSILDLLPFIDSYNPKSENLFLTLSSPREDSAKADHPCSWLAKHGAVSF
jgi:hypothetical protein